MSATARIAGLSLAISSSGKSERLRETNPSESFQQYRRSANLFRRAIGLPRVDYRVVSD